LAGAAGDARGDVQDPVAEAGDLAAGQLGLFGESDELGQVTRSAAAKTISSQAALASKDWHGRLVNPVALSSRMRSSTRAC